MRNSSARQQAFDFEGSPAEPASAQRSATGEGAFPNFEILSTRQAMAVASRRAGRLNAAAISEDEVNALLDERSKLLDKKFDGKMTRADEIRLTYVRWQLDRIDDAEEGAKLDALEALVSQYEQLQRDLKSLKESIEKHSTRKHK
ncbi:hypothetical protein [Bradyrhizobium sp. SZCCHNPS2010]|uniref:hypothetical protein n=1 Tax=Bradyrhizobium sp. SZCCHNPS2010 TaxID=3057333 RepID=UPI002915C6AB|nr:hypothetical protein [Bradyrhizobium sp. SZCCHNPS2010]